MTSKQREKLFLSGAGLLDNDTEDSIAIGCLTPSYCPSGIDAVMQKHTQEIDMLLQLLPERSKEKAELLSLRGFTFSEYQDLFNLNIPESTFREITVFRYFYLVKEKERRKLIYHLTKERYEDYLTLILNSFQAFGNNSLFSFFFSESPYRPYIGKKFRKPLLYRGYDWFRQKPGNKPDVLRVAKKISKEKKL